MHIDVQLADTAAAAATATELAHQLRQSTSRLAAVCPAGSGSPPVMAWTTTWGALQTCLLGLAAAAESLAAASAVALNRLRDTDDGVIVPDAR